MKLINKTILSLLSASLLSSSLFGAVTAENGVDGYKYNTMLIDVISEKQGTVISDYATLSGSNWDFENYYDRIKGVDGLLDLQVTAKIEIPDDVTTDSVVIKVNKGCVRHNYNDFCAQIANQNAFNDNGVFTTFKKIGTKRYVETSLKFKESRDYVVQYLKYFQDLSYSVVTNPTKRGERSRTLVPRVFVTE